MEGFSDRRVGDTIIKVRRPYVQITNENYRIIEALNLLMFVVKLSSYRNKVEDYLIKEHIGMDLLAPYIDSVSYTHLKYCGNPHGAGINSRTAIPSHRQCG